MKVKDFTQTVVNVDVPFYIFDGGYKRVVYKNDVTVYDDREIESIIIDEYVSVFLKGE